MAKRPEIGKTTYSKYLDYIANMPLPQPTDPSAEATSLSVSGKRTTNGAGAPALSMAPPQDDPLAQFSQFMAQRQPAQQEQPQESAWDAIKQGAATSEGARWGAELGQNLMEYDFGSTMGTTGTTLATVFPKAYEALKQYNIDYDKQVQQSEAELRQQLKDDPDQNEIVARWDQMVNTVSDDFERNPSNASLRLLTNLVLNPGFIAGMVTPIPGVGAARAAGAGRGAYMASRAAAEAAKDASLAAAQTSITNNITGVDGTAGQYGFNIGLEAGPVVALKGAATGVGAAMGKESGFMKGFSENAARNTPGTINPSADVEAVMRGEATADGVDPLLDVGEKPTPLSELQRQRPPRAAREAASTAMTQRMRPMGSGPRAETAPMPVEPVVGPYRTAPEMPEMMDIPSLGKWAQDIGDEVDAQPMGEFTPRYGLGDMPEDAPVPMRDNSGAMSASIAQDSIRQQLSNPRAALGALESLPVSTRKNWMQDPEVARAVDEAFTRERERLSQMKEEALRSESTGDWAKYMEGRNRADALQRSVEAPAAKVDASTIAKAAEPPAPKKTAPKGKPTKAAEPPAPEPQRVQADAAMARAKARKSAKIPEIKTDYSQKSIFGDQSGKADTEFLKFLASVGIGGSAGVAALSALQDDPSLVGKLLAASAGAVAGALGAPMLKAAAINPAMAAGKAAAKEAWGAAKDTVKKRQDVGGTPQRSPVGKAVDAARASMAEAVEKSPDDSWLSLNKVVPAAVGITAATTLNALKEDEGNVPDSKSWMTQTEALDAGYKLPSSGVSLPVFFATMAVTGKFVHSAMKRLAKTDVPASMKAKRKDLVLDYTKTEGQISLLGTRTIAAFTNALPRVQDRILAPFFIEERGALRMERVPDITKKWFQEESGFPLTQSYLDEVAPQINKALDAPRAFFSAVGEMAVKEKVMDAMLDSYVTHSFKYPEANKAQVQAYFDDLKRDIMQGGRSRFAAHRVMTKMYHALEDPKLKALGIEPKHRDLTGILGEYATSMGKTVAEKRLLNRMSEMKADDGNPFAVYEGKTHGPHYTALIAAAKKTFEERQSELRIIKASGNKDAILDARRLLNDARKNLKDIKSEARAVDFRDPKELLAAGYQRFPNHRMLNGQLFHPDMVEMINGVFAPRPQSFIDRVGALSNAVKRLQVAFSLFHAWSLFTVAATARGGSGPVSSFFKLPAAAISSGRDVIKMMRGKYDPLLALQDMGNPRNIDALRKAYPDLNDTLLKEKQVELQKQAATLQGLVENGLQVGRSAMDWNSPAVANLAKTIDAKSKEILGERLGGLMSALPRGASWVMDQFDRITWDLLHDGFKVEVATRAFDEIKQKNPTIPDDIAYQQAAKFANFQFGGLNWALLAEDMTNRYGRAAMYSMANTRGRNIAGIVLFAPDWLVSTIGAAMHIFPNNATPKEAAALYRMVQMRGWLWWATALQLGNMAIAGHPTWENKRDIFRLEIPIDDSLRMELNPLKHFAEFGHMVGDPIGFASNKMAYLPKAAGELLGGHKFGTNIPISKNEGVAAAPDYISHFVQSALPISSSPIMDSRMSPELKALATLASVGGVAPHAVNPKRDPKETEAGLIDTILKELGSL